MNDPEKPQGPPSPVEGVGSLRAPARPEAAVDVEAAAPAAEAEASASVASPGDVALAQALSTGAVDPAQARAQLIEEVLRAQLPADAEPELVEEVRAEVEALLADDPTLAALLDPRR